MSSISKSLLQRGWSHRRVETIRRNLEILQAYNAGKTQVKLAEELGCTQANVSLLLKDARQVLKYFGGK